MAGKPNEVYIFLEIYFRLDSGIVNFFLYGISKQSDPLILGFI